MLNGPARGRALVVAQRRRCGSAPPSSSAIATNLTPELYFCRDLQGYGWCFRKGEYLNVGLGRLDRRSLPAATQTSSRSSRRRAGSRGSFRGGGAATRMRSTRRRAARLVDDGVMLIGDAAGVAYPQSGEGIRPAIESGLLAAAAIVDARGTYSRDRLEPYAAGIAARCADAPLSGVAARLVPDAVKAIMAGQLLRIPAFVKRVVIDEWFLHRRQLALAL